MPLQSQVTIGLNIKQTKALDLGDGSATVLKNIVFTLTDGTGAGKADLLYQDTNSISAFLDIDLAGTLADAFGTTLNYVRVKGLYVKAADANTANVTVGGAAANGFVSPFGSATDKIVLRPGAAMLLVAGAADATAYAVTAATADLLRITPASGTQAYDIIVWGCSA